MHVPQETFLLSQHFSPHLTVFFYGLNLQLCHTIYILWHKLENYWRDFLF